MLVIFFPMQVNVEYLTITTIINRQSFTLPHVPPKMAHKARFDEISPLLGKTILEKVIEGVPHLAGVAHLIKKFS